MTEWYLRFGVSVVIGFVLGRLLASWLWWNLVRPWLVKRRGY